MKAKVSLLCVFVVFLTIFVSGCTTNDSGNNNSGNNVINPDDLLWLNNYEAKRSTGTGENDFWIKYPDINPSSGQSVEHLPWILDSLEKGCVLFVVHKTGCVGCQAQADRVIAFAEKYGENVEFYDLDAVDGASEDILDKAYSSYLYDPDGPPGYIALTGIFTLVKDNGEIKYGWHSWEGDVSDSDMEDWIKDGIYNYYLNSGGIK